MTSNTLGSAEIYAACVCLGLNRAARMTARRYDAALQPVGITSGQFSILSSLLRDEPIAMGAMADLLGMERTTLKRNLMPLEAAGLVEVVQDPHDRRVRCVTATRQGRALIAKAIPLWESAQNASHRRFGETGWSGFKAKLDALA